MHPFVGRKNEIDELEKQIVDHRRPLTKAIFVSGNAGSGRRSFAHHFFERQYPHVGKIFPAIYVNTYSGFEEIYRKVLAELRPTIGAGELKARAHGFQIASDDEKARLISELLNSLLPAKEAAFVVDTGGLLTDAGAFEAEINKVITGLEAKPHPPVVFIANWMIPRRLRRLEDDLSYIAIRSLPRDDSVVLISRLLKDRSIQVTDEKLDALVNLADGHPFNFYRMVEEIDDRGLEPFLSNPTDFVDWKHRHSSEYLVKINLSKEDIFLLALLELVPELDFTAITSALPIEPSLASERLLRLTDLHVVESAAGRFMLAPALRVAIERDKRITLPKSIRSTAVKKLAENLLIRLEEGTAPVVLIDSAILSAIESGDVPEFAAAFLLPSHYVSLSQRRYDERQYDESIRLAREALKAANRLSSGGFVAACRFMCLSAARTGNLPTFNEGISRLEAAARDDWARSNVSYLRGFNLRMTGDLPKAEEHLRKAYELSPGNSSAARELASICLARGNLEEAEELAREARSRAPSNPFLLDILISALVRRYGHAVAYASELASLFDALEKTGEEEGRSFFTTRRAEFEHIWGDNKIALKLIKEAVERTPHLFEPKRLLAEILLKDGNFSKAFEVISSLEQQVNLRKTSERRTNYRQYLETYGHYLTEVGKYKEAKELYDNPAVFTNDEKIAAVRQIEIVQGYKSSAGRR